MLDDYKVGYGKPPMATRFPKGRSGNPKGRPKGSLNIVTLVHRQGRRKMTITEGGKKKQISKVEAIILQLTNQAVSGDRHARQQYIDLHVRDDGSELIDSSNSQSDHLQRKLVKSLLKRSERMEESIPEKTSQTAQKVPLNVIS